MSDSKKPSPVVKGLSTLLTAWVAVKALRPGKGSAGSTPTQRHSEPARRPQEEPIPTQKKDGDAPDTPLELEAPDWKATAKRTVKEIKDDRVTLVAAGMAYYWFLAVFPAIIAGIGILGLMNVSNADINDIVASIQSGFPKGAGEILVSAVTRAQNASEGASLTAAIVGIAVALWSASSGMVALQAGLDVAYDVPRERKFIAKRLYAFALILIMLVLGLVPSPFFTFGESTIFTVLGWAATAICVIVMFALFYYLAPNRESPYWAWVSPGGLVGAVIWIAAFVGFSFYVNTAGERSYARTYGPIAGVVFLMLLLWLTALAVLIGGELNAELERQSEKRRAGSA